MTKSRKLVKFEKTAGIFLDFEKEYDANPASASIFSVELQKEEFKSLWETVKATYGEFATNNLEEDSEEDLESARQLFKNCRSGYITVASLMGELSQTFIDKSGMSSTKRGGHSSEFNNSNETSFRKHQMKLPPCTMEVFDGDYQTWPSFRDMFTAVYIDEADLSPVAQLFYLRQFTSGEALEIVKKSPLTNSGFQEAWNNLRDRYENKRILVNSQLKILFNLVSVNSESSSEIKRLQRDINNSISALRLHEIDISNWDPIFVYLCSINLPVLTLSLWEQTVKDKTEISKWSDLDSFLTSRFQSLETVSEIRSSEQTTSHGKRSFDSHSSFKKGVKSYPAKVAKKSCVSCGNDHLLKSCPKFLEMNPGERFVIVKRYNLCINCLSDGHKLSSCQSNFSCLTCKLKHHSLLHREVSGNSNEHHAETPSTSGAVAQNTNVQNCFATTSKQVLLGTAVVSIIHRGDVFKARALVDSGSQATFISEKLQRRLNLPFRCINAEVSGLNNALAGSVQKQCSLTLSSPRDPQFRLRVEGLVLPRLTGNLPSQSVDISRQSSLLDIELADPNFSKSGQVDLLIGGDIYSQIVLDGVKRNILGNLLAQETIFGWILTGPLPDTGQRAFTTCVSFYAEVGLDKQLEKFWALEEPPMASELTPDDEYCEDHFKRTTKRNSDGRYVVSLPFKPQYLVDSGLGVSREKAQRQFLRNEVSLLKNPSLKIIYDDVLTEYAVLGHMAQVQHNDIDVSSSFYLPHHAVFKPESSSTKVRVVFNASSRSSSGLSLNDILFTGPVLQNDLMLLIVRWRFYKYVLNGDIEKMYRQILLDPEETKFQRIVFRDDPNDSVKDFELKTVTFGVNCAPFLAIRTLHQLATDVEGKWPLAANILRRMMYVDDALAGTHDVSLAIRARDELILALSSAGFSMRKWTSNDERILKGLPADHLLREKFLEIDDESTTKTLGIRWNAKQDRFYFSTAPIPIKENFTKREVLSVIAKLFDPAGWLGPIVVIAKMLMQEIWSEKTDWDEFLSESSDIKWRQFLDDHKFIDKITISRWVGFEPTAKLEIHGFSDASEKAYGACVYVRLQYGDGSVQAHLLLAKSKVAPLKTVSLPRLELCGAVLLADLMVAIKDDLSLNENNTQFYTWSDSTIVLAWLQKPSNTWTTFVANRVSKIVKETGKESWRHVSSKDNPADLISRGVRPQDLAENRLWWHGPMWLCSSHSPWADSVLTDFGTREEERRHQVFFAYFKTFYDLLDRFSSYSRALRVMAFVVRGLKLIFKQATCFPTELTSDEIQSVKEKLIRVAQKAFFPDDYYKLSNGEPILDGKMSNLNPFFDEKGIIRVGGRLANAQNLTFSERFPIVLPSGCQLALLLVTFIHKITLHGGNQLMLRVLRTEFYIPHAKNLIKTVIGRCKICTVQKKATQSQIMAALPVARTIISRPFTETGVDFAGPFDIRNYTGRACLITKGYVCLFVCFATKAIHLEAVSSLSTPAFLGAFLRFVSRRGFPKDMHSDNGTNFVGASKVLKTEFRDFLRSVGSEVNASYGTQGLNWHFNPASAPHMGGLWEAGVKSFKHHFRRIAGGLKYTFEEFSTLLARVEACLNSRPLCPLSESADCLDVLTPGHFLIGGPLLSPPEIVISEAPASIINRWQRVKALNQRLCTRWKDEYLKDLQKRNKWKFLRKDIEVNDMVVIREDNLPTNEWRLGRVVKLHIGKDGHVRVVELKTERGLVVRPVVNIMVSAKKYAEGRRSGNKMICRVCLKDHPLRFCKKFLQVSYQERMKLVSIYKYCAGCLSHDHTWRTCESTGKCKRCGDMHHTLLHKPGTRPRTSARNETGVKRLKRGPSSSTRPKSRGPSSSQNSARGPRSSNGRNSEEPSTSQALVPSQSRNLRNTPHKKIGKGRSVTQSAVSLPLYHIREMIMLRPTAIIKIVSKERYCLERALIDPGAECSIISGEVARRLGTRTVRVGDKERCLISIRGNHGMSSTVETYAEVRRKHNVLTPQKSIDASIVDEFPGLQLADPQFHLAAPVHITLGGDIYSRIIRNGIMGGTFGKPLAQFTIFGYIISGSCSP